MHYRRRINRIGTALAAVLVLSTMTACSAPKSTSSATGGSLTIEESNAPTSMNPWTNTNGYVTSGSAYDSLLHLSAAGKVLPWLATKWRFTSPTVLDMTLRKGVKFADGTAFDAAAVKTNLIFGRDAKVGTNGQTYLKNITDVKVIDPQTVEIDLTTPNSALPYDFTQEVGYMVSPKALADPSSLKTKTDGTGPYVLDSAHTTTNVQYAFKRNPKYWAKSSYPFDTVVWKVIADATAATNSAASGEIDALTAVNSTVPTIRGWSSVSSLSGDQSGITGEAILDISGKITPALKDVRVRQALNFAVDRNEINKSLYGGRSVVVSSVPYTSTTDGYTSAIQNYYSYNPTKAKQLLAAAGYPHGFTFAALNTPNNDQLAQAVAGYLSRVGVTMKISDHTTDIGQQLFSGKWAVSAFLNRLTGDPAQDVQQLMTPGAFFNIQKDDDPKVDALLKAAAAAPAGTARTAANTQLGLYAAQQAWFIAPVVLRTTSLFNTSTVKLVPPQSGDIQLYFYHKP